MNPRMVSNEGVRIREAAASTTAGRFPEENHKSRSDKLKGGIMPNTHERYVNNELLGFISRPQYDSSCSMSSLTAVINYLYSDQIGIKTTKEWAKEIGIHSPETKMSPGNESVLDWFRRIVEKYGLKGGCGYFIQDRDVDWDSNPEVISRLKRAVRSKDQALIHHLSNHYNLVAGYFEAAKKPDDAYDTKARLERWIVLGEHSDFNHIPDMLQKFIRTIPEKVMSEDAKNLLMERAGSPPVWCRRWGSIRHDLMNTPKHCILRFIRND